MQASELEVRLHGARAGRLQRVGPYEYRLEYDDAWAATADATPLSLSLPLATGTHFGVVVHDFLDNLLPDRSDVRDRWAAEAALASTEPFALLAAYGRDVAGALEFVPVGEPEAASTLVNLSDREIAHRIAVLRADRAAWVQTTHGRFSLGGAQSKFALAEYDGEWFEPSGAAPATHVFKPVVEQLLDGEVIEHVVLQSIAVLGLPSPRTRLLHFGDQRSLVVERFDRLRLPDGSVQRLHQEDLLQALGRPRLQKYESEGGPTYRDVLAVLSRAYPADAEYSREVFSRALVLSWILLDTDAHAKNFSLVLEPGSHRLTPLYDRSSLIPYLPDGTSRGALEAAISDTRLSMAVLGSYRVGDVTAETWRTVARDARIDADALLGWAREACETIADIVQAQIRALPDADHSEVTERLNRRIRIRSSTAARAIR